MTPPDRPCPCGQMSDADCPCIDVEDSNPRIRISIPEPIVGHLTDDRTFMERYEDSEE